MFQAADFELSENKNHKQGKWRVQSAAHLNGLFMIDIDHVDVKAVIERWSQDDILNKLGTCGLMFITPSGEGLKGVFVADPEEGNLVDNQWVMAKKLGVPFDLSCKDSSRSSFAVSKDDIIYYNAEVLFRDYGKGYDEKYGDRYRKGDSSPIKYADDIRAYLDTLVQREQGDKHDSNVGSPISSGSDNSSTNQTDEGINPEQLNYGGTSFDTIAQLYTEYFGQPIEGDRHRYLIKMAGDLRYLVDNNARKLKVAVRSFSWLREWESSENNTREIDDVCSEVCGYRMWRELPKRISRLLADSRICQGTVGSETGTQQHVAGADNNTFWDRLQPLLDDDPTFAECTELIRPENKLAAVFCAGAMLSTLMTRCYYLHYDGEHHRLNPIVYIIGKPASNKSFAARMNENIMTVMKAADAPGRQAERDFKKEQRKRKTSAKAASGEKQLDPPEVMIRYIPSRTSNNVFYRRTQNAKEIVEGKQLPLHLYTFDSELDSSLTAQSGGSWIEKHDLELKAFHNEFSGVDYANGDSINDVIQVFWNQVITGTDVSLAKKINIRNINDGLCSRIAIIRMFSEDFAMMRRGVIEETLHATNVQREWGFAFDKLYGEIQVPKIVDYCYDLCTKAAKAAQVQDDKVLDFFRKRAVFYAEWFTIVRVIGRTLRNAKEDPSLDYHKPEVKQSDLDFCELIYDAVIYWQQSFFGRMLEEVWRNAERTYATQRLIRTSRNEQLFDGLPSTFGVTDVAELLSLSSAAARQQINRWKQRNLIKGIKQGKYEKV